MDERIQDIEVKLAYLEKRMLDLDSVVCELGDVVMALRDELRELRDVPSDEPQQGTARRLEDDVPPHY